MIAIVDYGMGNLRSVHKALEYLGIEAFITSDNKKVIESDGIILPGVGAFPDAMKCLNETGLADTLKAAVEKGKPLLGICLGMQLLFEESYEVKYSKGLGFMNGAIRKFEVDLKIPHMGWNSLNIEKNSNILRDVKNGSYVYFVHSFYADIKEENILEASTTYGIKVPAVVGKGNVYGAQFHPEKSGEPGMKILKNFGELVVCLQKE